MVDGHLLHRRGQERDLVPVLRGGRRDVQRQQVTERVDAR